MERATFKLTEEQEIAELKKLGMNHPANVRRREAALRRKHEAKEKAWDRSYFRPTPANLRGIKCATKEPWARDEKFYLKKTGSFEDEMNDNAMYDDRSALSATKGFKSEVTATGLEGKGAPAWNSSVFRPVPYSLVGLKPSTREPWAYDQALNRDMSLEGFDTFSTVVENDSVAGCAARASNAPGTPAPPPTAGEPRVRTPPWQQLCEGP